MKTISKNSKLPLYLQLVSEIKNKISINNLKPGDKIESEEVLVRKYDISRVTVRKALQQLCDEEILVKKQGKGTYVSAPSLIQEVKISESFSGYCKLNNKVATSKVISNQMIKATLDIAKRLGVEPNSQVIELKRLRLMDGVPAIFEIDYFRINDSYILDVNFEESSLLATVINNSSLDVHAFSDELLVEVGTSEIDRIMQLEQSDMYLVVNEAVLSNVDEIVYFNKQYINSKIYTYKLKSVRGGK